MADLVAWHVSNGEESDVVFAETEADVERMTQTTGDIERAPEFDKHSPGPVPVEALFEAGWIFECDCCGHRVSEDGCYDCRDEGVEADPVIDSGEVYCSAGCQQAEREHRADLKQVEDECRERCTRTVAERWPGATIEHITADILGQVYMRVPGCVGAVRWYEGDGEHVWVAPCDVEAWRAFAKKCKESPNG